VEFKTPVRQLLHTSKTSSKLRQSPRAPWVNPPWNRFMHLWLWQHLLHLHSLALADKSLLILMRVEATTIKVTLSSRQYSEVCSNNLRISTTWNSMLSQESTEVDFKTKQSSFNRHSYNHKWDLECLGWTMLDNINSLRIIWNLLLKKYPFQISRLIFRRPLQLRILRA